MSFDLIRRASGLWTYDPRDLPRYSVPVANLVRSTAAGGVITSNASSLFTGDVGSVNREAGSVIFNKGWNTWAADTYYTVASVASGSALVSNLISAVADSAQTATWRVTVDGVVNTIPVAIGAADERAVLGHLMPRDAYRGTDNYGLSYTATSTDGFTSRLTANHAVVLGPHDPRITFPLRFDRSLLVELKFATGVQSGSVEYSAVVMRRLT